MVSYTVIFSFVLSSFQHVSQECKGTHKRIKRTTIYIEELKVLYDRREARSRTERSAQAIDVDAAVDYPG